MFFSKTSSETLPLKILKTLETTLKLSISMKKFLKMMTYYISLKKSWKFLFKDDIFEIVDSNHTIEKPQHPSKLISHKKMQELVECYILLKR